MTDSVLRTLKALAVLGVFLSVTTLWAGEAPGTKVDPKADRNAAETARETPHTRVFSPEQNDRRIARWLAVDVEGAVECSKEAQNRASREDVKAFAAKLAKEHQECLDKLHARMNQADREDRAARAERNRDRDQNVNARRDVDRDADRRDDQVRTGRADDPNTNLQNAEPSKTASLVRDEGTSRGGNLFYRPTDFVQVKEDVCRSLRSTMKKELTNLKGTDYDRAFLSHTIFGHEAGIATLRAVRATASQELQEEIDRGIEKEQAHLKEARNLRDQLDNPSTTAK